MPTDAAEALKKDPRTAPLPRVMGALVGLAVQVTENPQKDVPADVVAYAATAPREYLDAVGVMLAFNFVTRVANALGVVPDVSEFVSKDGWLRRLLLGVQVVGMRWLVDLRLRRLPVRSPEENLAALDALFGRIGIQTPPSLRQYAAAPHLLEVQRELLEALLLRGRAGGPIELNLHRFMSAGQVVLGEIGATELREPIAAWLRANPPTTQDEALDAHLLPFARDVTSRSSAIDAERIGELRRRGLDDEDVLDLVSAVAWWNAYGRLERLLAGCPGVGAVAATA